MPGASGLSQLIAWWNLPFTLPFALAIVYLVLTASGLVDLGSSDAGDAADTDSAADVSSDISDADADTAPDKADAPEPSGGPAARALGLLGVGRVPLAIVIQVFLLVWGFSGWAATTILQPLLHEPLLFFWPALLIAAVCAVFATATLARPLARWLPSTESHAATKHDLTGRIGTVVLPVGTAAGTVHVRDDRGNLHQIACHVESAPHNGVSGSGAPTIPKGAEVIVVSYDEATGRYLVVPSDLPTMPALPRR